MTKARSPTTRTIQPANGETRIRTGYLLSRRHTYKVAGNTLSSAGFFPYVPRCQDLLQTRPSRWSASERHSSGPAARPGRPARVHRPSSATTGAADTPPGAAAPSALAYYSVRCAVRGAPCARRRACACAHVRPASATRDTGSRQCRRSHSGRRRRRSVRRRRRRRDAGRRALAHDRQGALRRWNLVILKHKLDVRADAGVAT